ncbi:hypothetical protein [Thiohalobacter thiocyanaticus]|uniref:Uncharacterized protein n=1 Tax=Thiohalobacter thiocyanaticus TaxID=585455 RepID=A0A426QIS0_9GAMM|nr:hypothetical protein [Thiohalobacter thiocyanaticus]RRQ21597.1 hypothetical protein D6C00_06335 [Thiohalobacter thiocyanaticus]
MPSLRAILRINATSCLLFGALFGALFAAMPNAVAGFLGAPSAPGGVILVLGVLLGLNGIHLIYVSRAPRPSRAWVGYFSAGDFIWVLGTLLLVGTGLWINTPAGILSALVVAASVGAMGWLQLKASSAL